MGLSERIVQGLKDPPEHGTQAFPSTTLERKGFTALLRLGQALLCMAQGTEA